MANHLACIGIPTGTTEELAGLAMQLAKKGDVAAGPGGLRVIVWRDSSGASMVFNLSAKQEILCVAPTFNATSRIRVVASGFSPDGRCPYCDQLIADVVDSKGDRLYTIPFQLEDIGITRHQIPFRDRMTAALTAFAESIETWPDEEAFRAAQPPEAPDDVESVIAAGIREADGEKLAVPGARAVITGRVARSNLRKNQASGQTFLYTFVRTEGAAFDVVSAIEDTPEELEPGMIVQGQFWIVGRVVSGLRGKARWTWVGKLYDK